MNLQDFKLCEYSLNMNMITLSNLMSLKTFHAKAILLVNGNHKFQRQVCTTAVFLEPVILPFNEPHNIPGTVLCAFYALS